MFTILLERYGINVDMVNAGEVTLFNGCLGKKHDYRRDILVEEIYREFVKVPIPESRYYLILEVGGVEAKEGCYFTMPQIKYIFRH